MAVRIYSVRLWWGQGAEAFELAAVMLNEMMPIIVKLAKESVLLAKLKGIEIIAPKEASVRYLANGRGAIRTSRIFVFLRANFRWFFSPFCARAMNSVWLRRGFSPRAGWAWR